MRKKPKIYSQDEKNSLLSAYNNAKSGPRGTVNRFLKDSRVTSAMIIRWTNQNLVPPEKVAASPVVSSEWITALAPKESPVMVPTGIESETLITMITERDKMCEDMLRMQSQIDILNRNIGSVVGLYR